MADQPTAADIVAFRDGERLTRALRRAIRTNPASLLALADARLLALAIRIAFTDTPTDARVDEVELLAYLQANQSLGEAKVLSEKFVGDAGALAQLLALRDALDPVRTEAARYMPPPPSEMRRLELGTIHWRPRGGILVFQQEATDPDVSDEAPREAGLAFRPSRPGPLFERSLLAEFAEEPGDLSEAVKAQVAELEHLLRQAVGSLQRYQNLLGSSLDRLRVRGSALKAFMLLESDIRHLETRLIEGLRLLSPRRDDGDSVHAAAITFSAPTADSYLFLKSEMADLFVETLAIPTRSATLNLSGDAGATPRLSLTIHDARRRPWPKVLVTMVEAGRGFRSTETDERGLAIFDLDGSSEPTLMVQAEMTIEFTMRRA